MFFWHFPLKQLAKLLTVSLFFYVQVRLDKMQLGVLISTHDYDILQLPSKSSIVMTLLPGFCRPLVSGDDAGISELQRSQQNTCHG